MIVRLDGWVRRAGVRVAVAVAGAAVLTALSSAGATAGVVPAWHLIELPLPPGGSGSNAVAVADDGTVFGNASIVQPSGQVVLLPVEWPPAGGVVAVRAVPGAATTVSGLDRRGMVMGEAVGADGVSRAVLWDRGRAVVLPSLGGFRSWVTAGNSAGAHVGASAGPDGRMHAVRWDRAGRITELASPPGITGTSAADIDDTGLVTGAAELPSAGTRAVVWDVRGRVSVLPDLGGRFNEAWTISRTGKILGMADRPEQASCDCHNTVYWNQAGKLTDLGLPFGAQSTLFAGMNDSGVIAGTAAFQVPGVVTHAIRWDRADRAHDLGTLPGGIWSRAIRINARDAVVGEAETADHATHAVYWDRAGRADDLGAPSGATWSSPTDVNDNGVVVGFFEDPETGFGRAVEWRRW